MGQKETVPVRPSKVVALGTMKREPNPTSAEVLYGARIPRQSSASASMARTKVSQSPPFVQSGNALAKVCAMVRPKIDALKLRTVSSRGFN